MQLLFETEQVADIKNMATLEEPFQEKILANGVIEELKKNSCNGNKENILKEDNIIFSAEENSRNIDGKTVNEEIPVLPECNIKLEQNDNEEIPNIDRSDIKLPDDKINVEKEDNQTTQDNSFDDTKQTVDTTTHENGLTISEESSEMPGTFESHMNSETNNKEDFIKTDNKICERGEMELDNDNVDEIIQIKKEIDNILLEKSASLNTTSLKIKKENNNTVPIKQNPLDTQTALEDSDEKDVSMQETEENSRKLISIQEKVEATENNEKNPVKDIVKEEENEKKVLGDEVMLPEIDKIIATEKLTINSGAAGKINDKETFILDEREITNSNINLETKGADCVDDLNEIVTECISSNEIKPSQISDVQMDIPKEDSLSVIEDNNPTQQLNISHVESMNEQDKINIEDKKETPQDKTLTVDTESSVNIVENAEENRILTDIMDCDDVKEDVHKDITDATSNDEVMVVEDSQDIPQEKSLSKHETVSQPQIEKEPEKPVEKKSPICRLSNNLNILSDDDDEPVKGESPKQSTSDKQCIDIEDDDDIMVIEEDSSCKDSKPDNELNKTEPVIGAETMVQSEVDETDLETGEKKSSFMESIELSSNKNNKEPTPSRNTDSPVQTEIKEKSSEDSAQKVLSDKPLLSDYFLKSSKKKISDMTRDDLEEFCVLKIVESIVDRSNLSEIKTKLKNMSQSMDEYRKKAMMLTKQNRDLQVVLKSIQEEQKKVSDTAITPLKITRSVGMQVLMTDKSIRRKGLVPIQLQTPTANNIRQTRNQTNQNQRSMKSTANQSIPVPRLVPANNAVKAPIPVNITLGKLPNALPNGIKNSPPAQKQGEKRPRPQSVTVDLTDDEPPTKINPRSPAPPVRLVSPQNLLATQRQQFGQTVNSPRKVYIPISGPQNQNIRPGQTFMLKAAHTGKPRGPISSVTRLPQNQVRVNRLGSVHRHPAPLPDAMKQYQPPNWKALPPAPDLKLSKVENGIVISWKIEGYQEDSYEEIASYQLYAYQETSSPPSTALWKKIGDVKALPLPMACTLTQFMAGYKYYFAVRAVDVRSRLGPFSLPGSILLLNKM